MKVAISGASGLIGSRVGERLADRGHSITRMVRSRSAAAAADALYWSPATGEIDAAGLAGHDAIVNLAGENIFGVWTEEKKKRIHNSRVDGTRLIAETIAGLDDTHRPAVLVNASAIGYYGDRPADQPVTEDAAPGDGFMAEVVVDWEAATKPAADAGTRVVTLRFGLVLDPESLLLRGTALSTRLGLGAKLGSGDQPFPWTTRDEVARVVERVLEDEAISGPVNVVGPERVTNEQFADTLARVLGRPRVLKVPEAALKLLGGLGEEVMSGASVVPERLESVGYDWLDLTLEGALRRMLDPGGA